MMPDLYFLPAELLSKPHPWSCLCTVRLCLFRGGDSRLLPMQCEGPCCGALVALTWYSLLQDADPLDPIANASAIPDPLPLFSKIRQQHHMPYALNPFQVLNGHSVMELPGNRNGFTDGSSPRKGEHWNKLSVIEMFPILARLAVLCSVCTFHLFLL